MSILADFQNVFTNRKTFERGLINLIGGYIPHYLTSTSQAKIVKVGPAKRYTCCIPDGYVTCDHHGIIVVRFNGDTTFIPFETFLVMDMNVVDGKIYIRHMKYMGRYVVSIYTLNGDVLPYEDFIPQNYIIHVANYDRLGVDQDCKCIRTPQYIVTDEYKQNRVRIFSVDDYRLLYQYNINSDGLQYVGETENGLLLTFASSDQAYLIQ